MIVFAGRPCPLSYFNDVLALTLSGPLAWIDITPPGIAPAARKEHSAIYDPIRDRMVIYGGNTPSTPVLGDVWSLSLSDPVSWSQLSPAGQSPPPRQSHAAIYDPIGDRMVVYGGRGQNNCALDDTWALSLSGPPTWTKIVTAHTPGARVTTGVYDPVRKRIVIVGEGAGSCGGGAWNDVWALNLEGVPDWSLISTQGTPPIPRYAFGLVYDPDTDGLVFFGGQGPIPYPLYNDTWRLSLGPTPTWSQLAPGGEIPPANYLYDPIYDPIGKRMIALLDDLGGCDQPMNTWALSLAATRHQAITASAGPHGSIAPSGDVLVPDGANQGFTITPDPCYHIVDVLVDGVSVGAVPSYFFGSVTEPHSIVASFAVNPGQFIITASAGPHGSISPSGSVQVECGADQLFEITPDAGYTVAGIVVDGQSIGPTTYHAFTKVQANHTIAVSFEYCWPYALSYLELPGFNRTTGPKTVPVQVGFNFDAVRAFTMDEGSTSCWHLGTQQYTLGGCIQQPATLGYSPSSACDVEKLSLTLSDYFTGDPIGEASQLLVADYPLLRQADIAAPNWGGYGDLLTFARAYAPVLKFSLGENYLPVRPEINLYHAVLRTNGPGAPPNPPEFSKTDLTPDDLAKYSWAFLTLDEPCPKGDADCANSAFQQALSATPAPRFCIYATAIRDLGKTSSAADDGIILQYWMNYYYNDFTCVGVKDRHEGDWEHVSIAFDANLRPVAMHFASHLDATPIDKSRKWDDVEKWAETERPVVYVSRGAHGNYATSGLTGCDHHEGDGAQFVPSDAQVQLLPRWSDLDNSETGNRWVKYSGYWGTENGFHDDNSPPIDGSASPASGPAWRGPAFRKTWLHPLREDFNSLRVFAAGAVDLVVTDAQGQVCSPNSTTIPLASYQTLDSDEGGDGSNHRVEVQIPDPSPGRYQVKVITAPFASRSIGDGLSSVWVASDWLGAASQTIVLADSIPISSIPPFYDIRPAIPFVGNSVVSPLVWGGNGPSDIEWRLDPGSDGFDVSTLIPESLRLNGTVEPILPVTVDNGTLIARFPYDAALASIVDRVNTTSQRVTLEGRFADSLSLEASTTIGVDVLTATVLVRFIARFSVNAVHLEWELQDPDRVATATLERAASLNGPWTEVSINTRRVGRVTEADDRTILPNEKYAYRLRIAFTDGTRATFGPIEVDGEGSVVASGLGAISPNPMSGSTRIEFGLARSEEVKLDVVDVSGRQVTLLAAGRMPAGRYSMVWDGRGRASRVPAGVYYVRWSSGSGTTTKKLVLVR